MCFCIRFSRRLTTPISSLVTHPPFFFVLIWFDSSLYYYFIRLCLCFACEICMWEIFPNAKRRQSANWVRLVLLCSQTFRASQPVCHCRARRAGIAIEDLCDHSIIWFTELCAQSQCTNGIAKCVHPAASSIPLKRDDCLVGGLLRQPFRIDCEQCWSTVEL